MTTPAPGFRNPILPGFHPDPTVCRVGDWYYLAVSSFQYFPGIPLYRSRDLVHWEPVGHALTRPSQLPPSEGAHSDGIFAPTLRHDGRQFYLITTHVRGRGTIVLTADRIEGPWSDPVVLDDAPGIDPSLYFENGRAWITGTADVPEGPQYFGNNEIWIREWDPKTGRWLGPRTGLWRGAVRDAVWPEGPHIYHHEGWYYLLISEGGTADDHAVTVARSREITGPYTGHKKNPILTHRHLGKDYPVVNVGHPDLVTTPEGDWWMVLLGSRPHHRGGTNRGRETFLVPVGWEDGWPVVAPGRGLVEIRGTSGPLPAHRWPDDLACGGFDGFEGPVLGPEWQFLRTPSVPVHSLTDRPGWLTLYGQAEGPGTRKTQAWVGRRIVHEHWTLRARIEADLAPGGRTGLCVIQSDDHHLRVEARREGAGYAVRAVVCRAGREEVAGEVKVDHLPSLWEIFCQGHTYQVRVAGDDRVWRPVGGPVDGTFLTTETAGGFVGCLAGPFAVGGQAAVDWVDLRGYDE